jgi:hypothetical protein
MTKESAATCLAALTAAYSKELPKPTARIYIQALQDLPPEPLAEATAVIIKTSRWFPSIAEIRETTMEFDDNVAIPSSWDSAWADVMTKIRREGRNRLSEWSNDSIPEALDAIGGYQRVCDATSIGLMESRFKTAYERTSGGTKRQMLLGGGGFEEISDNAHPDVGGNVININEIGKGRPQ